MKRKEYMVLIKDEKEGKIILKDNNTGGYMGTGYYIEVIREIDKSKNKVVNTRRCVENSRKVTMVVTGITCMYVEISFIEYINYKKYLKIERYKMKDIIAIHNYNEAPGIYGSIILEVDANRNKRKNPFTSLLSRWRHNNKTNEGKETENE